jgi:hypothetical protein
LGKQGLNDNQKDNAATFPQPTAATDLFSSAGVETQRAIAVDVQSSGPARPAFQQNIKM